MANIVEMIIFALYKFVIMISNCIQMLMADRGVNQTTLCNDLSLTVSNFNAFLHGKRSMPFKDLIAVMKYLRLSVAPNGSEYGSIEPENMTVLFRDRVKQGGFKMTELAAASGINASTITSVINGYRMPSSNNLGKLMQVLGVDIVKFKSAHSNGQR